MASSFYSFLQVGPRRSIWQKTEWEKITWPAPTSITFVVSVDLATFATNDDNAAICKWIAALEKTKTTTSSKRSFCCHWLLHSIYWTRTHVRSGRSKETVKSMSSSSSQPRDLAWYPSLMHLLQHEFLIVYLPHGAFWHSFLEPAHCQWELPTSLKELHGKSYISEVVE